MKIVIITGNNYPCGDAGAVRQHAMAKLLMDMGHDVFVIDMVLILGIRKRCMIPYHIYRLGKNPIIEL